METDNKDTLPEKAVELITENEMRPSVITAIREWVKTENSNSYQWRTRDLSPEEIKALVPADITPEQKKELWDNGIEYLEDKWIRWYKHYSCKQVEAKDSIPMPNDEEMAEVTRRKAVETCTAIPSPENESKITDEAALSLATLGFVDNGEPKKQQTDNPDKVPYPKDPYGYQSFLMANAAQELHKPEVKELIEVMKKAQHIPIDKLDLEWGQKLVTDYLLANTDISERRVETFAKEISTKLLYGIQNRKFPNPISFMFTNLQKPFGMDIEASNKDYNEKVVKALSEANAALDALKKRVEENGCTTPKV
jgi:hypothetical protein